MSGSYINLQRYTTNSISRIVFGVYFLIWISLGIYAIFSGDYEKPLNTFFNGYKDQKFASFARIAVTIILSFVFIGLIKIFTTFFVYAGILFLYLVLIESFLMVLQTLVNVTNLFILPIHIFNILLYFLVSYRVRDVGITKIGQLIKDSCNATFKYPQSFLITAFCMLITALQVIFITIAVASLINVTNSDGTVAVSSIFLIVLIIIGSFWPFFLIIHFNYLTISTAYASWYLADDKNLLSTLQINQNVNTIARHHFGTLCYGSSIMTIYHQVKTIFSNRYDTDYPLENKESQLTLILCKYFLFFSNSIFAMSAYTVTILKGTDFATSIKEAYDLVIRQPIKFMVTLVISGLSISVIFIVVLLVLILTYVKDFQSMNQEYNYVPIIFTVISSVFVILTIITPITVAFLTIIVCNLNDDKVNSLPTTKTVHKDDF